jgi:hypothetical protein
MSNIDVVGFLPAPPSKAHAGAADILESAFAYAVATSICVYEVCQPLARMSSCPDFQIISTTQAKRVANSLLAFPGAQAQYCMHAARRAQSPCHSHQMV